LGQVLKMVQVGQDRRFRWEGSARPVASGSPDGMRRLDRVRGHGRCPLMPAATSPDPWVGLR